MGSTTNSKLHPAVLAVMVVFSCKAALTQPADLLDGRLFSFTDAQNSTNQQSGFSAECAGKVFWFEHVTEEQARKGGCEPIVFTRTLLQVIGTIESGADPVCFTRTGNFISCRLAERMEKTNHSEWKACKMIELKTASPSQWQNFQSGVEGISRYMQEHVILSVVGSAVITATVVWALIVNHYKNKVTNARGHGN